jgi:hypothetical protein
MSEPGDGKNVAEIEILEDYVEPLTDKKNHASQLTRNPSDMFFQYGDITGIPTAWGGKSDVMHRFGK